METDARLRYAVDYVADAQLLKGVPSGHYDLVYAAHVLEHIADVFLALRHWLRVLVPGGVAVVVLPDPCQPDFMDRVRLARAPRGC